LEELVRGGYSASGGDALFLLMSPIALAFLILSVVIVALAVRSKNRVL